MSFNRIAIPTGLYSDAAHYALLALHNLANDSVKTSGFAATYLPEKGISGEIEIIIQDDRRSRQTTRAMNLTLPVVACTIKEVLKRKVSWYSFRKDYPDIFTKSDVPYDFDPFRLGRLALKMSMTLKLPSRVEKISYDNSLYEEVLQKVLTMDVPIRDMVFVMDYLNGLSKKTLVRTYGEEYVNKLVGSPRNPFIIENEKLRKDEHKAITAKFQSEINRTVSEYNAQIEALRAKRERAVEDLKNARLKAMQEFDASIDEMLKTVGIEECQAS